MWYEAIHKLLVSVHLLCFPGRGWEGVGSKPIGFETGLFYGYSWIVFRVAHCKAGPGFVRWVLGRKQPVE